MSAAPYQLASGKAVMAIGGFNGGTGSQITAWVAAHYTAKSVGGTTVYDLISGTT